MNIVNTIRGFTEFPSTPHRSGEGLPIDLMLDPLRMTELNPVS